RSLPGSSGDRTHGQRPGLQLQPDPHPSFTPQICQARYLTNVGIPHSLRGAVAAWKFRRQNTRPGARSTAPA
ncbi:hypothetical protein RRG08_000112, partial [Elysia crispata]